MNIISTSQSDQCSRRTFLTDKNQIKMIQDFEYIDLGLSVKWASCNAGADKPEDYGNYYDSFEAQKLDLHLPTKEEWNELIKKCSHKWTKKGMKFTGPNGNSIFLPAAGFHYGPIPYDAGSSGIYWSSSLCTEFPDFAWYVYFDSDHANKYYGNRCYGQSVRPVQK